MPTPAERQYFDAIIGRTTSLRMYLAQHVAPAGDDVGAWFAFLEGIKAIQGNANNDLSFLSCLLAKGYLEARHGTLSIDIASKAQGASGLDIDARSADGCRIVAEVKTMRPYLARALGAQQRSAFAADIGKLRRAEADFKYLFVTDRRAYEVMSRTMGAEMASISVVHLATSEPSGGQP